MNNLHLKKSESAERGRWVRYNNSLTFGLGENGERLTGSAKHIELSRNAACEGMVLLENNGVLPLKVGSRVALFGVGSIDHVYVGGGSGHVYPEYFRNVYEGFALKEPKVAIYRPLSEYYYNYVCEHGNLNDERPTAEIELPSELLESAAENADTAVIVISRYSCEGDDRVKNEGDFLLTDTEEKLVADVTARFNRVVAVLNVGGMVDTSWIKKYSLDAALLAWQAGQESGLAIADILCGDVNPSGKLTDTFAASFDDYPSADTFNESNDYVDYFEDVYVGYRYFETIPSAKDKVIYPFGYGLSYTTFDISKPTAEKRGEKIVVTTTVKNTGTLSGKEVVQCYYSAPQGKLGKPSIELVAFQKTRLLAPAEEEKIVLEFNISDMSSYDDLGKCQMSAYILEGGEYTFFVGNSSRNLTAADYKYTVESEFIITEQLTQKCAPNALKKRLLSNGEYEELPSFPIEECDIKRPKNPFSPKNDDSARVPFAKVASGEISIDEFISQLTDDELTWLMSGCPSKGTANTAGFGDNWRLQIPSLMTVDGPAGVRLDPNLGIPTTALPCATLLACTWNPDILYEMGKIGAIECKENGLAVWLTPAINIHRNPLCGRNFEYFSEDPLIAGVMGAAKIKGIQSQRIACSVKHFACNNKETNRFYSDSRLSERALREIYLKPFEICVKTSDPWTIMTSYNIINGRRCCESGEQLDGILRGEWGFKGMITSDWFVPCDHKKLVKAGNDVHMPSGFPDHIKEGLKEGYIDRSHLEYCTKNILEMILKLD